MGPTLGSPVVEFAALLMKEKNITAFQRAVDYLDSQQKEREIAREREREREEREAIR
jgi:hypothetical protein